MDKNTDELYISHRSSVKRKNVKVRVRYFGKYFLKNIYLATSELKLLIELCQKQAIFALYESHIVMSTDLYLSLSHEKYTQVVS